MLWCVNGRGGAGSSCLSKAEERVFCFFLWWFPTTAGGVRRDRAGVVIKRQAEKQARWRQCWPSGPTPSTIVSSWALGRSGNAIRSTDLELEFFPKTGISLQV